MTEVTRVRIVHQRRLPWNRHTLLQHRRPVHAIKERVPLYLLLTLPYHLHLLGIRGTTAQSRRWISVEKSGDEIARLKTKRRLR